MSDTTPKGKATQNSPYQIRVEAGKTYFWCACGLSAKQPFCDGSHKGSAFVPLKYACTENRAVFFCGCRASGKKPFCDGTHNKL